MEGLCIVQEVGMFGELEVNDPTCKKVNTAMDMTQEELEELIAKTHEKNLNK